MEKNYDIVLRQCLEYAYTKLDIKEHTSKYVKYNNKLHFIFELIDEEVIEFKIKVFKIVEGKFIDLNDNKIYNLFRHRLEKIINVKNFIKEIIKNINILQKRNVEIYNELNINRTEIENLKDKLTYYKKLEIGALYE